MTRPNAATFPRNVLKVIHDLDQLAATGGVHAAAIVDGVTYLLFRDGATSAVYDIDEATILRDTWIAQLGKAKLERDPEWADLIRTHAYIEACSQSDAMRESELPEGVAVALRDDLVNRLGDASSPLTWGW